MPNDDPNITRVANLIQIAIPSKYGPAQLFFLQPDDARDFARCLLELADQIDASSKARKIPRQTQRPYKPLKLIGNPKTEP